MSNAEPMLHKRTVDGCRQVGHSDVVPRKMTKGKIVGTDYTLVRGDGVIKLNVQAIITTHDGERFALYADGVGAIPLGASTIQLR
jgi:hypothetical protein